jgi:hypothetical protein
MLHPCIAGASLLRYRISIVPPCVRATYVAGIAQAGRRAPLRIATISRAAILFGDRFYQITDEFYLATVTRKSRPILHPPAR